MRRDERTGFFFRLLWLLFIRLLLVLVLLNLAFSPLDISPVVLGGLDDTRLDGLQAG